MDKERVLGGKEILGQIYPVKKLAAKRPALFFGIPSGSRPIMRPAPRIVGITAMSMTSERSCHLSDR